MRVGAARVGDPLVGRSRRVQLPEHLLALFGRQPLEGLPMRLLDRLRWRRADQVSVALERLLVRTGLGRSLHILGGRGPLVPEQPIEDSHRVLLACSGR